MILLYYFEEVNSKLKWIYLLFHFNFVKNELVRNNSDKFLFCLCKFFNTSLPNPCFHSDLEHPLCMIQSNPEG